MLGYHGTTIETYTRCVRFAIDARVDSDQPALTPRQLRFDSTRDPRNVKNLGVAYHYALGRAASDALNDAFEHNEWPLIIGSGIRDVDGASMRLPFGAWFPIRRLYLGRKTWRTLEPQLIWDYEQPFKGHFSRFEANFLLTRAERMATGVRFGKRIERLVAPLLAAQHEAYARIAHAQQELSLAGR